MYLAFSPSLLSRVCVCECMRFLCFDVEHEPFLTLGTPASIHGEFTSTRTRFQKINRFLAA